MSTANVYNLTNMHKNKRPSSPQIKKPWHMPMKFQILANSNNSAISSPAIATGCNVTKCNIITTGLLGLGLCSSKITHFHKRYTLSNVVYLRDLEKPKYTCKNRNTPRKCRNTPRKCRNTPQHCSNELAMDKKWWN